MIQMVINLLSISGFSSWHPCEIEWYQIEKKLLRSYQAFPRDSYHFQLISIFIPISAKERGQKKNGIMWEKFPSGGPPPPSLGIFTFIAVFFAIL